MKRLISVLLAFLAMNAWGGEFRVEKTSGAVSVREGVDEAWAPVMPGDLLKPEDSMRTGPDGSAVLVALVDGGGMKENISLPPNVILDLSDIRTLSKDELILKMTMEKVKASPYEWKENDLAIPNATVVHGEKPVSENGGNGADIEMGNLQINGTKVLFDHGFFSTCALKSLSLFSRFPSLRESFDNRLRLAESLERTELRGEALSEYSTLAGMPGLTTDQKSLVQERIARLKNGG